MNKSTLLSIIFTCLLTLTLTSGLSLKAETKNISFHNSGKVLSADLPFSELVKVGNMLYLSGQLGAILGSLKLIEGGIKAETKQTMDNIKTVLETHGYSMKDLVKCTVMLADIKDWAAFNDVYKTYFTKPYPARSAFGTSGLGLGAKVEVECMGAVE